MLVGVDVMYRVCAMTCACAQTTQDWRKGKYAGRTLADAYRVIALSHTHVHTVQRPGQGLFQQLWAQQLAEEESGFDVEPVVDQVAPGEGHPVSFVCVSFDCCGGTGSCCVCLNATPLTLTVAHRTGGSARPLDGGTTVSRTVRKEAAGAMLAYE